MALKLYEVKANIEAMVNEDGILINTETGEVVKKEDFEKMVGDLNEGIENMCLCVKNLRAEAKAIKEEKENLEARQKAAENKADNLAEYIKYLLGGEKFKTPKCSVTWRTTHPVVVEDDKLVPAEWWKQAKPTLDRKGIGDAIKNGIEVPGCRLGDNLSMTIK